MAKDKSEIATMVVNLEDGFMKAFGEKLSQSALKTFAKELCAKRQLEYIENRLGDLNAEESVKLVQILEGQNE